MVFQYPGDQFFTDTVEEEIAFGLTLRGLAKTTIKDKVDSCMSLFGLEALRNNNPRDLSGGEQQRLALASVTINNPPILILDEPTRGSSELDKTTLFEYLLKYRSMGNTVIVVSHDVETVAKYADRVVILNEGKIECAGETHQVLAHSTVYATQIHRLIRSCRTNQPILQVLTVDEMMAVLA
jgi:energy-coupling factor transporter ATP-binding protein EcfA2